MKNLIDVAEYLVDAFTVILRQVVGTGSLIKEARLCSVELFETLLSFYSDFHELSGGSEPIFKLSNSVLLIQKELGLPYIPELLSVKMSLFLILTQAEFEHEQLFVLKIGVCLFKWKIENVIQMWVPALLYGAYDECWKCIASQGSSCSSLASIGFASICSCNNSNCIKIPTEVVVLV